MSAPPPTAFEDQVAAALHRRAAPVTVDADARATIDRRIAQRARTRRVRCLGAAAVVVVALLAGAIALLPRGHDDAGVVTGPGVPAVHIPRLGLPSPGEGRGSAVTSYVPGRSAGIGLYPKLVAPRDGEDVSVANPALGAGFTLDVTAVSPAEFVEQFGPDATVTACHVNEHPAQCVSPPAAEPNSRGLVVWQPADGVLAKLSVAPGSEPETAGDRAAAVASQLIEMDDADWWTRAGAPAPLIGLGLPDSGGHAELNFYGPSDQGGSSGQVFDVPGWAPGTFQLFTSATAKPQTSLPTEFAGVEVEDVTVRGTPGVVTTIPRPLPFASPFVYTRSLIWVEGGLGYRLDFPDGTSTADAIAFAARLSTLSEDGWHDLLYPETVRPDLVPMPDLLAPVSPATTGR
jgi:hypothetical protein